MNHKSHWPRDTERNARSGPFAKPTLGVRSGELHRRLARCDVQIRGTGTMFRPPGMSGVPMICFRFGSAFGTGMVIEGQDALMLCVQY
jgi:hypothetical protein